MYIVSEETYQSLINEALASFRSEHVAGIENVAFLFEQDPTPSQREQLNLRNDQSLFGLYEGVPLPRRQGNGAQFPDRITLFKGPMERSVSSLEALRKQIHHTLWHEIGHYYGLDHKQIAKLDRPQYL